MVQGILNSIWQCTTINLIGRWRLRHILNWKKIIIVIIIAVVAISIGLYTILPLFTNTIVDEPLPTASGMILGIINDENLI